MRDRALDWSGTRRGSVTRGCERGQERTGSIIYVEILVNKQLDTQFFLVYICFNSLHVSSTHVLIIRRINFINTTSDICHSM